MSATIRSGGLNPARSIRGRLLVGFGLTAASLLLVGAGMLGLGRAHGTAREQLGAVLEVRGDLAAARDAVQQYVVLAQGDLLGGGEEHRDRMAALGEAADSVRQHLAAGTALGEAERARLERIGALQARIGARLAIARAHQDLGEPEAAVRQARLAQASLDSLFAESAAISDAEESSARQTVAGVDAAVAAQRWSTGGLLGVALLVALGLGVGTWRGVARPLARLTDTARRLGEGDLRVAVDPAGLQDEYRVVAEAFGGTTRRLAGLVGSIQREAGEVSRAAAALQEASEQAANATGQISAAMAGIAQDAEEQIRNLEASRHVLERVAGAAVRLDRTAGHSAEVGAAIRAAAREAQQEIGRALGTLQRARDVIGGSSARVERLEESSRAVEAFVETVHGIARQTDLLALNAAIEAARAGEHGRGFAVVADEVRKLATHNEEAAHRVRSVVDAMREQVAAAVTAFGEGVGGLGDVDSVSRGASTALEGIGAAVARIGELAEAVREGAETNRAAVEELKGRLAVTAQHAASQAASSEEAAAGSQETTATVEAVSATAGRLAENSARLDALVAAFQV